MYQPVALSQFLCAGRVHRSDLDISNVLAQPAHEINPHQPERWHVQAISIKPDLGAV